MTKKTSLSESSRQRDEAMVVGNDQLSTHQAQESWFKTEPPGEFKVHIIAKLRNKLLAYWSLSHFGINQSNLDRESSMTTFFACADKFE